VGINRLPNFALQKKFKFFFFCVSQVVKKIKWPPNFPFPKRTWESVDCLILLYKKELKDFFGKGVFSLKKNWSFFLPILKGESTGHWIFLFMSRRLLSFKREQSSGHSILMQNKNKNNHLIIFFLEERKSKRPHNFFYYIAL
jgi:hypothetical protein